MATHKAIGIDRGTTYSCVAVWHFDKVKIITNDQGNRTTPSMVAFTDTERLVGDGAKNQIGSNPENTIFDVKRLMGRRLSDPQVQSDKMHWPFTIVQGNNNNPAIQVTYRGELKSFAPEEISAMVLIKMKEVAKMFLNFEVNNAVITVPAYFNDSQRQATMDAADLAGFDVFQLLNEPNAAAIAYGLDTRTYSSPTGKNILVFDVGGGTFDVSVITVKNGSFEVKAVGGDTHLGGEDFDNRIVNHFMKEFQRKNKKEICRNAKALRRLRTACEKAKRNLSAATETLVDIDCLYEGIDFCAKISRAKFEDLNNDLFSKCMDGVEQCLADANMGKEQIHQAVLVGGSSRIPKLQKLLAGFFGEEKLCRSINQDEAVAYGAAVHGAVMTGQRSDVILSDVTLLSLGIAVQGNIFSVMIPKDTRVPVRKVASYLPARDYQRSVSIKVYEGERTKATDNNLLGTFELRGIQSAPRGKEKLEACFDIDANGILKVSVVDRTAGVKGITISWDNCRLSKDEIDKMKLDAETYRAEDEQAALNHRARQALESFVYERRNAARDQRVRGTMSAADAYQIHKVTKATIEWIDENTDADAEEFEKKLREMEETCNAFHNFTL